MSTGDRTSAGGNWPVMLTPFNQDKSIDWTSLDNLIEWYLDEGSKGLFAVCQSSEMYSLDNKERIAIAKRVVERVAGRVPVIATGTFSRDINTQADFIKKMYDTGVEAVVALTNHLAKQKEPESVWIDNAQALLEKTDNISLGMYECPLPYKRLIPKDTMAWAASTGRFYWSKDTSEDLNQIQEKLKVNKGSHLSLYNAHTASLLESLKIGAFGFSGIASNFFPKLYSWMCDNWENDPQTAKDLQQFLTWGQAFVDYKYPMSAKQYLVLNGVIEHITTRLPGYTFNMHEIDNLNSLRKKVETWRERLGIFAEAAG